MTKVENIATGLDELDNDMRSVGWLVTEARKQLEDFADAGIYYLTMDIDSENGIFAEFMDLLKKTIELEKSLHTCGKPECELECTE